MNPSQILVGPTTDRPAETHTPRVPTAPETASPAELPLPGNATNGPGAASFLIRWALTRLSACAAFILAVHWASDAPLWLVGVGLGPFFIIGLAADFTLKMLAIDVAAEEAGGPEADANPKR